MRLRLPLFSYAVTRTMAYATSRPTLRGVVFDMDGTLTKPNLDFAEMYEYIRVDATPVLRPHTAHTTFDAPPVLRPHTPHMKTGASAQVSSLRRRHERGHPWRGCRDAARRARGATAVIDEMEAEGRRMLEVMPGAVELLRWLHAHEVPTALVTRNTARPSRPARTRCGRAASPRSRRRSRATRPARQADPAARPHRERVARPRRAASCSWSATRRRADVAFGKAAGAATALLDSGRRTVEGGADGGADIVVHRLANLPRALFERFEIGSALAGPLRKYPTPTPRAQRAVRPRRRAAARGDDLDECNAPDADGGNTPLVWAADAGHAPAVEALLDKGVAVSARGYLGATACARACRAGHVAALAALLAAPGCDPNVANDKMQSPLHFAAFKKQPRRSSSCSLRPAATHSCSTARAARRGDTERRDGKARRSAPRRTVTPRA